jgi:predicted PurR-regulated permease PerM
MKIEIPLRTYVNFFFALIVAFVLVELRFQLMVLFIAMIVAMSLYSAEKYFIKKGLNKKLTLPLLITFYLSILIGVIFVIIPNVVSQMMNLSDHYADIKNQILLIPYASAFNINMQELIKSSPEILAGTKNYLASVGTQTIGGFFNIGIFFIVSLYMFIDGSRSYDWCRSHFTDKVRGKLDQTVEEIQPIMSAYVFGQAMTSTLAAIVVYVTAQVLHIPGALTLGVLAAVFDILPGIGFILIALTSAIMSLAVSLQATLAIFIVLVIYYFFESYVLTPYIYGNRMKLSPLVVLLSLILAGTVAGVPAMIAILPIVAAYGTIERIWLKKWLL